MASFRRNWRKYFAVFLWLAVVVLCFIHRDKITVENILGYSPKNPLLAAAVIMGLFVFKGLTMAINGNIIYMACGIMFSLPVAVAINLAGTVAMTTISFFTGKLGGSGLLEKLVHKYKKLEILRTFPRQNEFRNTFLLRLFGILPCEPVGMYLGACGLQYSRYIPATALGLLPAVVCYAIMGKYMYAPGSAQFIAAVAVQLSTSVLTLIIALILKNRRPDKTEQRQ